METTLLFRCCHYLPPTSTTESRLTKSDKTRTHVGSPMRLPISTLRFVSSNIISIDRQRIGDPLRFLFVNGRIPLKLMATKLEESEVKDGSDKKKQEEEELTKNLPDPPEKPEPGDCCGSGCVRCVWDVYYEELEAYNRLCKPDPKNSISNSS
ncbi:hypothetical protein CCACVL1_26091 [Corchorus capsularis]|uniref:Oxidoreductase-like domain-containing protein n=1 Tax=Corchorus capsularis TaxID=210143 RepID=A0A1R3GFY0_COCAP|nr:hypothetical protein CCACVL1_26091 [Corchorus capsularis]